jgi:hypothetical protein
MTRRGGFDVLGAAKSNPEGLLLLAAGLALLMRSGGSSGSRMYSQSSSGDEHFQHYPGRSGGWRVPEAVSQATQTARDYAAERVSSVGERISGMGEQVREAAGSYAASATNLASEAGRNVTDHSMRFAQQAQSRVQGSVNRVLQEQPLAVVLAGLAAGAAVAAMFPTTQMEQRALGPAGERVADFAERTGDQLKEAASKAGERLMSAAEERGLNADGLKEVAREVAGAFGSSFSGEQGSGGGQPGTKQSSSSSGPSSGSPGLSGSSGSPGSPGLSGSSGSPGSSGLSGSSGTPGSSKLSGGSGLSGSSGSPGSYPGSQSSGMGQGSGGSSAASARPQQGGGSSSDMGGRSSLNPDAARSPQAGKANPSNSKT